MPGRFGYSRWDGSQAGFTLEGDDVLAAVTDDLLYHGDINAALRRLLQTGFRRPDGQSVAGLRELLEEVRRRRQRELRRHDLGSVYDDVARQLDEVVDMERRSVEGLGDHERSTQLDLLPPDLGGRIDALQHYDFTSPDARQRFEELVERLRSQLLQGHFNRMAASMADVGPEQLQRTKDMLDELNRLLEMRQAGLDTSQDFERFMQRFGDMFPGRPATLDQLVEQMARQMAAMESALASMSPDQRAELEDLARRLLDDMDLAWQLDRLGANLRTAAPDAGWGQPHPVRGPGRLDLPGAASASSGGTTWAAC
ncbi:MAG TPA: hypothetical protein VG637_11625, partial [Actinomycetes bacterium]|nr:hypothetical protein [Actinomycetes bacterium]